MQGDPEHFVAAWRNRLDLEHLLRCLTSSRLEAGLHLIPVSYNLFTLARQPNRPPAFPRENLHHYRLGMVVQAPPPHHPDPRYPPPPYPPQPPSPTPSHKCPR